MSRVTPGLSATEQARVRAFIRERDTPRPIFDAMLVPDGAIAPFESPWSAIHKLAWLNGCGPRALLDHYYRSVHVSPKDSWCAPWGWLEDLRWCHVGGAEPHLDGQPLMDALRARVQAARGMLNYFADLRYCSACVNAGWHSTLHQWSQSNTCLLHGEELRRGCPRCSSAMDTKLATVFGDAAYACSACSPIVREDWSPFPKQNLLSAFETVGSELQLWSGLAADMHVRAPPAHYGRAADEWADQFDTFNEARTIAAVRPPPPALAKSLVFAPVRGFSAITYEAPGGYEILQQFGVEEEDEERAAQTQVLIRESIASIEHTLISELSQHHGCLAHSEAALSAADSAGDVSVHPNQICPVSLAVHVWRHMLGALVARLGESRYITCEPQVSEAVLQTALRSHFYVVLSDMVARAVRSAGTEEFRWGIDSRAFTSFVTTGFRTNLPLQQVIRGVVDYSEWVAVLPCMTLRQHWEGSKLRGRLCLR